MLPNWLGDKNLFQTFSDPIDCDVQEVRELIDGVTSDPSNAIVPIDEGEAK
jgi:hypothetical protein